PSPSASASGRSPIRSRARPATATTSNSPTIGRPHASSTSSPPMCPSSTSTSAAPAAASASSSTTSCCIASIETIITRVRERLGRYELVGRLATGGMGELFVARAAGAGGIEKRLVVKRILPQYAANEDFVKMFLDEARIAAGLHHANIVQTFDVGCDTGHYFLVMERLEGRDLRSILRALGARNQRMPLRLVLLVASQVLAALQYAHELVGTDGKPMHIVHRDVSPGNLFISDGVVKLLDFGLARASQRAADTRSGTWKGKFQ